MVLVLDNLSKLIPKLKKKADPANAVWYVFVVVLLAITWSGIKAVQTNYNLQKQISRLKQQNTVLELQNQNQTLANQYLASDQYNDLAARQSLGLAAPGETVLLVPRSVAMKYVSQDNSSNAAAADQSPKTPSKVVRNLEAWRDFVLGRTVLSD